MSENINLLERPKARVIVDGIEVWCHHQRLMPVEELTPNPRNLKSHPEAQIELLAKYIKRVGWRSPLIVSLHSGVVIDRHARLLAAQKLGVRTVPVDLQYFQSPADETLLQLVDIFKLTQRPQINLKRRKGPTKTCPVCEFPFHVPPSASTQIFCSSLCKTVASRVYPRNLYQCLECGRSFTSPPRPKSNNANHYCSLRCRNLAYRQLKGPRSRSWKGGMLYFVEMTIHASIVEIGA